MEAEKFHPLLSTSWSTREASGVSQSEQEGLRNRAAKVQEDGCNSSSREQMCPSPTFLFYLAPNGFDVAHLHWSGPTSLLSLQFHMLISPDILYTHPGLMF